jgi:uncharacterized protein
VQMHLQEQEINQHNKWLPVVCAFYAIEFIVCAVFTFTDYFDTVNWLLIIDGVMAATALGFTAIAWKQVKESLRWPNIAVLKLLGYSSCAVVFSLFVHLTVGWLNESIFGSDNSYYIFFSGMRYPLLGMLLTIAVQPAIFEELAYRGFLFSGIKQLTDEKQSLFIASFAFALIHFSFLSFFWLLPFAIWLGYIRIKENTIWYGVVIHFVFNATSVLCEYYNVL